MRVNQLYSGSSGNLYEVTASNGRRILLECGTTWAKLQKALNYNLSGIEGCFVSHSHFDHSKSIGSLIEAGIEVYANAHTFDTHDLSGHRRVNYVDDAQTVKLGTFQVFAFEVQHDVPALGFIVLCDGEYLLFATDTAFLKQHFEYKFNIIMLECSFDREVLQQRVDLKEIHESLAKRLLTSHMEKNNCMAYIRDFCKLGNCTEIHLLHLSGDNIDKRETQKEFEHEFFINTKIIGD
jgi:phosphoribosyl 1,2-cyclic phosphodiesterase